MTHVLNNDFLEIAKEIINENKSPDDWALIEASDMFQRGNYVGGAMQRKWRSLLVFMKRGQYWFQLTLDEIQNFVSGKIAIVQVINADL